MRIGFGIVALVVVLAIVASLAKRQLHAVQDVGASASGAPNATPAQQARNVEQQFKDATNRALQQGAERAASDSR